MNPAPYENELIVDSFCGGGGASEGIRMATGRDPDVAINHDPEAVAMHLANHPNTRHYCKSIYKVDPDDIVREFKKRIGLAWFSPDCTHHSKARGGKPKEKHIRDLAWVVVHWAERAVYKGERIRTIYVENVEEFKDWGPLLPNGKPDPERKGEEFRKWVKSLQKLGYKVEWRELRACDFGAPTIRKRLFIIARCDGEPIVWPEPTHGPGRENPYRTAAECIDWSLNCPSIFLSKEEAKPVRAKRPLAEATLRRVAHGVKKFVIDADEPFIVNVANQNGETAPFLTEHANASSPRSFAADEPLRTQCAEIKGGHFAAVAPTLIEVGYGEAPGQAPRVPGLGKPLGTAVAGGGKHALIAPLLVGAGGPAYGGKPTSMAKPYKTIVKECHTAVAATFLAQHNNPGDGGVNPGRPADEAISTITNTGSQQGVVSAFIAQHNGQSIGTEMEKPNTCIVGTNKHSVVAGSLVKLRGTCKHGQPVDDPMATVSAQGTHIVQSAAFMTKYYGTDQCPEMKDPLHTVTAKDRFGLSECDMTPEPLAEWQLDRARAVADLLRKYGLWDEREFVTINLHGTAWIIVDIGIRMLTRRELFNAQGFRVTYIIAPIYEGKPMSNTASVRMCGNSVSPPPAAAIIRANMHRPIEMRRAA